MSFSQLNAAVSDLREALLVHAGAGAFRDLNVRPPASDSDEGSFLRLVAWCYVLFFEAGRVTVPFLLRQAADAEGQVCLRLVGALRSWCFHNLGFESVHDLERRRTVSHWMLITSGATTPRNADDWRACFNGLSSQATATVLRCNVSLTAILSLDEDRELILNDLRRRIDRNWEAHVFDRIVEDAAVRHGRKINARAFREPRLDRWRGFVASLADDADLSREIERLIDDEIASHFRASLPVTTKEIIDVLHLAPGPEVGRAIEAARLLHASGATEAEELLAQLKSKWTSGT